MAKNVLTSIHKDLYQNVPNLSNSTGSLDSAVIYCNPLGGNYAEQKTQVWPPIYDITLYNLSIIQNLNVYWPEEYININYSDGHYGAEQTSGGSQGLRDAEDRLYNVSLYTSEYDINYNNTTFSCYDNFGYGYVWWDYNAPVMGGGTIGAYVNFHIRGHYESYSNSTFSHAGEWRVRLCSRTNSYSYIGTGSGSTPMQFTSNTSVMKLPQMTAREWYSKDNYEKYFSVQPRVFLYVGQFGIKMSGADMYVKFVKEKTVPTFTVSINRSSGPILMDSSSYTYLRDKALKFIYVNGNFPTSSLTSQSTYGGSTSTTWYSKYTIKDNDNNLYYNGSSYKLFLKPSYIYNEIRVPNYNYKYNSYNSNLTPALFGYYFAGYFTLPDSYSFGTAGSLRNYTGKNLLDFDTNAYTSKYRLFNIPGATTKGWYTTRKPILWYGSFSSSGNSTTYSINAPNNTHTRVAGIFLSSSSSATFTWNNGGGYAIKVEGSTILNSTNNYAGYTFESTGGHGNQPYVWTFGPTDPAIPRSCWDYISGTPGNIRLTLNTDFLSNIRSALTVNCQVLDSNIFTSNIDNGLRWSVTSSGSQSTDSYYVTSSKSPRTLYIYSCWYKPLSGGWGDVYGWAMKRNEVTIYWDNNPGKWQYEIVSKI